MTLQMNRSWEDEDFVVGPLAEVFRCCPSQFQVIESFVLDRIKEWKPPERRRERLEFLAERCPRIARDMMETPACRESLEWMARNSAAGGERPCLDAPLASPQLTVQAMAAVAASLIVSKWFDRG